MYTLIQDRALLRVSGADAESFLQSQFSNDIKNINHKHVQINAYCQHQGKVIAIIWVLNKSGNYYLSFPNEMKNLVTAKLNMFKLMSKVEIQDFSEKIYQYGLINEANDKAFKISETLSLLTTREPLEHYHNQSQWEKACIDELLPEISLIMSEKHIPQSLNLDINQMGVSFTKGCYPGQEVVARMHYLGKPKRRLFRFTSKCEVFIGDSLNVNDSNSLKASGQVIRVTKNDNEFHFLAVFEVSHTSDQIFLNSNSNKLVVLENG